MRWNDVTYSGWGRRLETDAKMARPERHAALSQIVGATDAVLPVGAMRSYGDAALAGSGRALSTLRLDRLLDFDPDTGILEAEAGVALGEILRVFAPRGFMPPVLPGTGATTLGGAIANDIHGKNHHEAGTFGAFVQSLTLILADGQSRVVTEEDQALWRATIGGVGQTGLIASARIRLVPCPAETMQVRETRMPGLAAFLEAFETSTAPFQVGWIDAVAQGDRLGRGLMEEADFSDQTALPTGHDPRRSLPGLTPGFLMIWPVVRAFNSFYYHRVPGAGRTRKRALTKFFFPLDRISNWNILYGRHGFHQFQGVIPTDAAGTTLRALLSEVHAARLASPLAVLKKMGPHRSGMMSFPIEGYSLALDIPNRSGSAELMTRLEAMTRDAGGRIYLAKDGSADPGDIGAMYQEFDLWRETIAAYDPGGKFRSRMGRRLDFGGQGG